ncbi:hypothetical protein COT76_01915 [Candidatus Berkelbacteria bacterium CG10_big_fil_rev_8_21_14_0_10_33_10]|nr:MAG: hypothetical protein COT76_01915 [Candidatus Berkelbacteria bacterium CG10_big_fil_rev_8_21_14_0_10_33_10]
MSKNNNPDLKKQYDLLYENISRKLDQQVESLGSIDTKASILLATIGVLFAGYLQLLASQEMGFKDYRIFVILEILSFLVAGFYVFKAFMLSKKEIWRSDPRPQKLIEIFSKNSNKGEYWLKDQIIKNMNEAYEHNDGLIIKKYNYFLRARGVLYFGIIVLVFHLISLLFSINNIIINLKF